MLSSRFTEVSKPSCARLSYGVNSVFSLLWSWANKNINKTATKFDQWKCTLPMDVVFDDTVKVAVLWSVMHVTAQAVNDLQSVVHNKSPGKRMPDSSAATSPTSVRTSPVARHTWLDEAISSSNTVPRHILADKLRLPNTPVRWELYVFAPFIRLFIFLWTVELWILLLRVYWS